MGNANTVGQEWQTGGYQGVSQIIHGWCDGGNDPSRVESIAGEDSRRPRMTWDMTWSLVIFAVAFVALGVLLLVVGARQEAMWRHGGRRAMSHEHMPSSGTGLVTALINRAPYSPVGRQRSGAHGLEHELLLPCNFEAGVEMGITKIVAVYRTCPVMLVGETAEGALLELSLPAVADVHELLPLRLWQDLVEQYHVFQVT